MSGQSYEDYIANQVFAPLQMKHSATSLGSPAAQDLAKGYRYWFTYPLTFQAPYPRRFISAGFLISSAEDMSHYLIAQLNGGAYAGSLVLSPQGIETLHTPGPKAGSTSFYAMGWTVRKSTDLTQIYHGGDVSNFHANVMLLPDQQLGIVVLMNVNGTTNSAAINVPIEGVAEILLGRSLPVTTDPSGDLILLVAPLVLLVILLIWIGVSFAAVRRWQRRAELPPRRWRLLWCYILPLSLDLFQAALAWVIVSLMFATPFDAVSLFSPDLFFTILLITLLALVWAVARTFLTLRPLKPADAEKN